MSQSDERPQQPSSAPRAPKRPYEAPAVRDFGSLAALTAGGSGFNPEGQSGMVGMH